MENTQFNTPEISNPNKDEKKEHSKFKELAQRANLYVESLKLSGWNLVIIIAIGMLFGAIFGLFVGLLLAALLAIAILVLKENGYEQYDILLCTLSYVMFIGVLNLIYLVFDDDHKNDWD